MKHEVLYHHGGEVVCTCGGYFRTENLTIYPLTGLAKFAAHVHGPLIRQAKDDALEEAAQAMERTISDHAARIIRDLKSGEPT